MTELEGLVGSLGGEIDLPGVMVDPSGPKMSKAQSSLVSGSFKFQRREATSTTS